MSFERLFAYASFWAASASFCIVLSKNSPAAFRVNVRAQISFGFAPPATSAIMRFVRLYVFPDPALASVRSLLKIILFIGILFYLG